MLRGGGAAGRAVQAAQVVWSVAVPVPQRPLQCTADDVVEAAGLRHRKLLAVVAAPARGLRVQVL